MGLIRTNSEAGLMIQTKLQAAGLAGDPVVLYGDRDALPSLPCITIEVLDKKSNVTSFLLDKPEFAAYIFVYYGRYADPEITKLEADQFAESVIDVLNEDVNWKDEEGNQRVVRAWVTRNEPGYARRGGQNIFAARITWEALSHVPLNPGG